MSEVHLIKTLTGGLRTYTLVHEPSGLFMTELVSDAAWGLARQLGGRMVIHGSLSAAARDPRLAHIAGRLSFA